MLTKSPAARTAIVYVTVGSLILIWTAVWYVWMVNYPPESRGPYYIVAGLLATGLTLLAIGLGVGRLGYSARHADNAAVVVTSPANTTAVVTPPTDAPGATPAVAPPPAADAPRVAAPSPPITANAGPRYHRPSATPMDPQRT
jgi:hypothetical protein